MGVCLKCFFNYSLLMHQESEQNHVFQQSLPPHHGIEGATERLNKVSTLTQTSTQLVTQVTVD